MSDFAVRKVQKLASGNFFQIVLPKKYMVRLGLDKDDFMKIYVEGNRIVMEKGIK